jgi:hypothetical protein
MFLTLDCATTWQLREQAAASKRAAAAAEQASATTIERLQKTLDAGVVARDELTTKLARAEGDAARESTRLKQARATVTALEEQLARIRERERAGAAAAAVDESSEGDASGDGQGTSAELRAARIEIDELHGQLARQV